MKLTYMSTAQNTVRLYTVETHFKLVKLIDLVFVLSGTFSHSSCYVLSLVVLYFQYLSWGAANFRDNEFAIAPVTAALTIAGTCICCSSAACERGKGVKYLVFCLINSRVFTLTLGDRNGLYDAFLSLFSQFDCGTSSCDSIRRRGVSRCLQHLLGFESLCQNIPGHIAQLRHAAGPQAPRAIPVWALALERVAATNAVALIANTHARGRLARKKRGAEEGEQQAEECARKSHFWGPTIVRAFLSYA